MEPGAKVVLWSETRTPVQMWSAKLSGPISSLTFPGLLLDVKGKKGGVVTLVLLVKSSTSIIISWDWSKPSVYSVRGSDAACHSLSVVFSDGVYAECKSLYSLNCNHKHDAEEPQISPGSFFSPSGGKTYDKEHVIVRNETEDTPTPLWDIEFI